METVRKLTFFYPGPWILLLSSGMTRYLWFCTGQSQAFQAPCRHAVPMHGVQQCNRKIEKAMASIRSFRGVEISVADVDTGIVAVVGKVNPTELRQWLKRKTKKDVKIVCPNPPVENHKQGYYFHNDFHNYMLAKKILVLGSSSRTGDTTLSAPPLPDQVSWALVPSGVQSDHEDLQLIEEKIRNLEMVRDMLKIKNLENELIAVKCELKQSRKAINGSKKALLDSALNQLKAYKKLEALSQSLCD